jgi:hypothetical protein
MGSFPIRPGDFWPATAGVRLGAAGFSTRQPFARPPVLRVVPGLWRVAALSSLGLISGEGPRVRLAGDR